MLACLGASSAFDNIDPKDVKSLNKKVDAFYEALYDIIKIKNDYSYEEFKEDTGKIDKGVALFSYIYGNITPEETQETIKKEQQKIEPEKKNQESGSKNQTK
jgi:hypothetical protein